MSIDNIFFEYPYKEFQVEFEEEFTHLAVRKRRIFLSSICAIAGGILCLILFIATLQAGLIVLAVLLILSGSLIIKTTAKTDEHRLEITAGDNGMKLVYLTNSRYYKRVLTVDYDDIISASFTSHGFERIQLRFRNGENTELKTFNTQQKEIPNAVENLIEIDLVPNSLEQGFFLFIAKDLFPISNYNAKKIEKKYGTAEEYFENIGVEI